MFELDNFKNEANHCETSFKNEKFSAELTASYQCVVRFCETGSYEVHLRQVMRLFSNVFVGYSGWWFGTFILFSLNVWNNHPN